ncbi:MAG: hypothetical protein QOH57_4509 [Mycobacterium sp.]|nr:hypothetical protein [Mycobacterium sp.]
MDPRKALMNTIPTWLKVAIAAAGFGCAAMGIAAPASAAPYAQDPTDCDAQPDLGICQIGRNLIEQQQDPANDFGGEVLMSFQRRGLSEVATFQNTSAADGQCHYDAQDVSGILPSKTDDFHLGANSTVTRTYPAPPPFSTYHATVTCNGTFAGIPVQYGNASQDVSG